MIRRFGLPGLLALGLLGLTAYSLVSSRQLLTDAVTVGIGPFLIPLAGLLSLGLLGLVLWQIWRLWKARQAGLPGQRLKVRVTAFFAALALLASLPQGFLALNFLDGSLEAWFGSDLGRALEAGHNLVLDAHEARLERLRGLKESPWLAAALEDQLSQGGDQLWALFRTWDPQIGALQRWDSAGRLRGQWGRAGLFLNERPAEDLSQAPGLIRLRLDRPDLNLSLLVSLDLPAGFVSGSRDLSRALESYYQLQQFNSSFRWGLVLFYLLFSLPLLFVTLLLAFTLSERLVQPVARLESATRQVASGNYEVQLSHKDADELDSLVSSFNQMVSELTAARRKLVQTEKISAWQEIAQQLAHELRNPLTPIRLSADRLLKRYEKDPASLGEILEPSVSAIVHEVKKLDSLLKEFSDFARLPSPRKSAFSLKALVDETLHLYQGTVPGAELRAELPDPELHLAADRGQLGQVLSNLVKNALEALGGAGEVTVQAERVLRHGKDRVLISVRDTGSGIRPEDRDRLFNPYFTTKREGTGLGLSIVERIVFDHQGHLWFESELGKGTVFFVELPWESA